MNYDTNEARKCAILNKEYWSTDEAEFYMVNIKGIQITSRTLRTMISRGGGPRFYKLGRTVRYTRSYIDRWIDERMSPPKLNSLDNR